MRITRNHKNHERSQKSLKSWEITEIMENQGNHKKSHEIIINQKNQQKSQKSQKSQAYFWIYQKSRISYAISGSDLPLDLARVLLGDTVNNESATIKQIAKLENKKKKSVNNAR